MVVSSREAGGLGLSAVVARQRVAGYPQVLSISKELMQKRAAFLDMLGVRDGRAAMARTFQLLCLAEDRLHSNVSWLKSQGIVDVKRALPMYPQMLSPSAKALSPKLDFMRSVVGLENSEISGRLLLASLDKVLRPRYFYALQCGVLERLAFSTLVPCSDATFLKKIHRHKTAASATEVAAYKAHIASSAFRAYMDEQEQQIRARSADGGAR